MRPLDIFSPARLSLLLFGFAFATISIPPRLYEAIVGERNLMFFDPGTLLLIGGCAVGYYCGLILYRGLSTTKHANNLVVSYRIREARVALFAILVILLSLLRLYTLIGQLGAPNVMQMIVSPQDYSTTDIRADIRSALSGANLGFISALGAATLPLLIFVRAYSKRPLFFTLLTVLLFVSNAFEYVLSQTRGHLLFLFLMCLIVMLAVREQKGKLTRAQVRFAMLGIVSAIAAIFVIFSVVRAQVDYDVSPLESFGKLAFGYFVANFNRIPIVLSGKFQLPFDFPSFTFGFLLNIPGATSFLPIKSILTGLGFNRIPSDNELWYATFDAVASTGLDRAYNWLTSFGCLFYDFGWFSILAFIVYGYASAKVWSSFRSYRVFGLMCYPYLAVSILCWFGAFNIFLLRIEFVFVLLVAWMIRFFVSEVRISNG